MIESERVEFEDDAAVVAGDELCLLELLTEVGMSVTFE